MSQLLPAPRKHGNRHEGTKALKSCGIPCAVWGEDLLRHFGVPTIIFDHFMLVPNPETAASKLESLGFHPLPPNPRYLFLEAFTRNSIRLSSPKSDVIPPLSAVIERYIDTSLA